jgi:hypothetical protein
VTASDPQQTVATWACAAQSRPHSNGMSDELHLRPGLPAEFRYLEAAYPRGQWPVMDLHPMATHWLEIHGWFRGMAGELMQLGELWREGKVEIADYRRATMPRLRQFLGNLHGHHHHESGHYFPALALIEPAMAKGFELLDRDHDAVERLLSAMAQAANALNGAMDQSGDRRPLAATMAEAIESGVGLIGRHLDDEEEIVVPVLTLRGDPFQA